MVEMIDWADGELLMRRPDGSVYMQSSHRHAASLLRTSFSVTVSWPKFTDEAPQFNPISGATGWSSGSGADTTFDVVLGSYGTIAPTFILANINASRSSGGNILNNLMVVDAIFPRGVWVPLNGSAWMERIRSPSIIFGNRHMSIGVTGGNIVLRCKQSTKTGSVVDTGYSSGSLSSETTWAVTVNVDAGFFDL